MEAEWVAPMGSREREASLAIGLQTELSSRASKPSPHILLRPSRSESASQCTEWHVLLLLLLHLLLLHPSLHFPLPLLSPLTPPRYSPTPPPPQRFTRQLQLLLSSPSPIPFPTFSPQHPPPTQLPPLHIHPHPPPTQLPHQLPLHPLSMDPPLPNPTATHQAQPQPQFSTQPHPIF